MLGLFAITILLGLLLLLAAFQKKARKLHQIAQGLLVSYLNIVLLFGIGEAYFRFVYAESTSFLSLSHENWLARYVQNNSEGYRYVTETVFNLYFANRTAED